VKKPPTLDLRTFSTSSIDLAMKIIQDLEKHRKLDLEDAYDRTLACCALQRSLISIAACFMDEQDFKNVTAHLMDDFKLTKKIASESANESANESVRE
jgi:hypothetical protein